MQPPRSDRYDDVYFSAQDGRAETMHVFIEGNDLPARWQGRKRFTVTETGFGTGLNFLTCWKLFAETAEPGAFLDYVSVEKYPLSPEDIRRALSHWPDLKPYLEKFLKNYPVRVAGFHRIVFDQQVALTLIFDDVNEAFSEVEASVDAWFLDGFTPAKNPDMWTEEVFGQMARLSAPAATFATFTAAGFVKRGLQEAGFTVEKRKGFGHKRDMLAGHIEKSSDTAAIGNAPETIAIIGGGLAGTACAYVLRQYGLTPVIYESGTEIAGGASGNRLGLYNPRFSAQRTGESDFFASAYAQFIRTGRKLDNIHFNPCGALHLVTDENKDKKFKGALANWNWHEDHIRRVDAKEASEIAGVNLVHEALHLPDSGGVDPASLCQAYAQDVEIKSNNRVEDIAGLDADAVIYAGGFCAPGWLPDLPLETVRGQVTYTRPHPVADKLKTVLCYGGYAAPSADGLVVGATFQKWLDHTEILPEDDASNLQNLMEIATELTGLKTAGGRASLRCSSKDRFPLVGAWTDRLYLTTAFGSHGIIGSLAAAHLLADFLRKGPVSLPRRTVNALSPDRFAIRKARKSGKNI